MKKKTNNRLISIALISVIVVFVGWMLVDLIPLLKAVADHAGNEEALISVIHQYGAKGAVILIALQILQVVTTVFPSAPIQILAGLSYGIGYGLIISVVGLVIGNMIVFTLARQIEYNFHIVTLKKQRPNKKRWDFSFLKKSDNAMKWAFILFLVPGVPNGILPYIFAKTEIKLREYLVAVALASVPSILICTFIGERISSGDIVTAAVILAVLLCIFLGFLLFRTRIMKALEGIRT